MNAKTILMVSVFALAASVASTADTFIAEGRGLLYVAGTDGYSDAIADGQSQAEMHCRLRVPRQLSDWQFAEKEIGYSYYVFASAEFSCGKID